VHALAAACALICACGLLAIAAAAVAVRRFCATSASLQSPPPPVTVLRPLCGAEPMLEQALASLCRNTYPAFQIVFGVQDPSDPALAVVGRIRAQFPARDIALVVDSTGHGANRKVSNLINMMEAAKHDVLVCCDSDLHVAPDYLDQIVAALQVPGTGLVTTVCSGLPVVPGVAALLGASAITHCFVPGALLSRELGREDCLGTTMALHRDTLTAIGGMQALRDHLADDNALGRLVRRLGLSIAVARTIPGTAVTEASLPALWRHELRWARTIRALEPVLYGLSVLQYPLFWAALCCALSPSWVALGIFAAAWWFRAVTALHVGRQIQPGRNGALALLLLPPRDLLSVAEVAASFLGTRVVWRGQIMRADPGPAELGALEPVL
jgi:ceramide glucosyltransferase